MSRLGKLPVEVPSSVKVDVQADKIVVKGNNAELTTPITGDVDVSFTDGKIWVKPANDSKRSRAMWGTVRSNVKSLVEGATTGFSKTLEIKGVGFRASVANNMLTMTLGFSHEIKFVIPAGITISVDKQTSITIKGANKQQVGQVAAQLRSLRKPEPYKGKGVRYSDETIRMKEGKKK